MDPMFHQNITLSYLKCINFLNVRYTYFFYVKYTHIIVFVIKMFRGEGRIPHPRLGHTANFFDDLQRWSSSLLRFLKSAHQEGLLASGLKPRS